jgi:hypothetical protein
MVQAAAAKKGFHFSSDGIHAALFVEAENIEEATKLYQKLRKPLTATPESTVTPQEDKTENELQ